MSHSDLLDRINFLANDPELETIDDSNRKQILESIEKLRRKVETPADFTIRSVFGSHQAMVLRLAVDLGLFDAITREGGTATTAQLAKTTGGDETLVSRITRFLAAMNIFDELGPSTYKATRLSTAFTSQSPLSAVVIHATHTLITMSQLPTYFAQTGWKTPTDATDGPFQQTHHTRQTFFEHLDTNPHIQQAFNTVMSMDFRRSTIRPWFELYPTESKLLSTTTTDPDPNRITLVDVGGNQGKDLVALCAHFPHLFKSTPTLAPSTATAIAKPTKQQATPPKLILQDLPTVLASIPASTTLPGCITIQPHNFFEQQPTRHAKAYFLRTVLHDWPDKQALQILGHLRDAMAEDSVLLVNEGVIPETGAGLMAVQTDFVMMCNYGAMERTKAQWVSLLERGGFEVCGVFGEDENCGDKGGQAGPQWFLWKSAIIYTEQPRSGNTHQAKAYQTQAQQAHASTWHPALDDAWGNSG
ncbi:S-adenosyl-L-methionine-dependent methyltransferase [Aspergillus homomorphus CBS 101889]|uniref:S-adenosyl-L-methionine-dependent methyltransferase n=1 Tax=Aspergillus homomorphus (strain CBS 101889) TaxID=1450537 RepID=A0A395I0V9_ASPHC|nr:S-adenosyl-L-methionine-dependent methyltransferase [Aspergillus homomorphus CBS 101889]RAL13253.1 S-adenosyl-L-methionine-dependent methyltransferase [Aspergillus homomorphus CBS 101889]